MASCEGVDGGDDPAAGVALQLGVVVEAGRRPAHLVAVLGERLAALAGQQGGQLLGALADLARHLVEHVRPVVGGDAAPLAEGGVGGGHRAAGVLLVAHRRVADHLLGGRVLHLERLAGHARDVLAADPHLLRHRRLPLIAWRVETCECAAC
jgi:hypothetical protein